MTRISAESTLAHTAKWMRLWAEAEAQGEVVDELEDFPDGSVWVLTRWPARHAYVVHQDNMRTIAAMGTADRGARYR